MKVLLVGGSGMLGSDVATEFRNRGIEVEAPPSKALDLTDPESVARVAAKKIGAGAEWCVNCAAYTAVDGAETERDKALALNALGPGYLGRACAMAGIRLLHVSTDFVFDGTDREPYHEEAPPNPLGVYGESKRLGEEAALSSGARAVVVRTSWLYGPNGKSFPRTMIRLWREGKPLRVVDDQVGTPTYTADLARVLVDLVEKNPEPGIYHAAGPQAMSWHEFAVRAVTAYRDAVLHGSESVDIEPIPTAAYPTPARRPAHSVLSFDKLVGLGIVPMRPVREALAEFVLRLPEEL